ncbi:hypothetical protein NLI96_g5968 [Meripilus lineatus]|uniref:Major facilitator superfamily (MFS) profile domain-containing protein n=1 Tax=Meripilus lineatus TaxID=2056292 RepID=A0AAD5YDE9_9APHY|nr:hypothetical protein NLI96_g5968 [Physisporinus lineatus]
MRASSQDSAPPSPPLCLTDKMGGSVTVSLDTTKVQLPVGAEPASTKKGFSFWMVFLAICLSLFLFALEMTAVSTALPTIISDVHGSDFVWVSSAYSLASTCLIPASGGLAEVFGRRPVMLGSIALFALGSALCGSAKNMSWFLGGRGLQGAGGGAIFSLSSIIIGDLVPLRERGVFQGTTGLVWTIAAGIGPVVGGALTKEGQWRWLFYLNLPISGVAFGLVLIFLTLKTPPGTFREKLMRMDWISAACVIALSWGGIQYPWTSAHVLAPLILGLLGICAFLFYEHWFATEPIIPFTLLTNRTSLSGYIQTFINPIAMFAVIYFLPAYYQACLGASPLRSGVLILSLCASIGPAVVVSGASIGITKKYRVQLWLGWILIVVGMGVLALLHPESPLSKQVGLPIIMALGAGAIYAATYFPVLAPLPISENAHALALFAFLRSFAAVWGVTIGTTVLQNELRKRVPAEYLKELPGGVAIVYSAIPLINSLPEPLKTTVRGAYADSTAKIWEVMCGLAAIGLIASLFMESLPLHTEVDRKWGLEQKSQSTLHDAEK